MNTKSLVGSVVLIQLLHCLYEAGVSAWLTSRRDSHDGQFAQPLREFACVGSTDRAKLHYICNSRCGDEKFNNPGG